jgi:hypothetical protein
MTENNWSSDNQTNYFDPIDAFESRRLIYQQIIESQKREHYAFNKISKSLKDQKLKLLELLSNLLLSLDKMPNNYLEIETFSNCSLNNWIILQNTYRDMMLSIEILQKELEVANEEYHRVAPLGFLTELLADDETKIVIQKYKLLLDAKKKEVNELQNQINDNIEKRKQFGYVFMRNCLTNIEQLKTSVVFGNEIQEITQYINDIIITIWNEHLNNINELVILLENQSIILKNIYQIHGGHNE